MIKNMAVIRKAKYFCRIRPNKDVMMQSKYFRLKIFLKIIAHGD